MGRAEPVVGRPDIVEAEWEERSQWWAERVARAELVVGVERVTQGCASSLNPPKADRRRQPPKAAPAASGERGGGRGQVGCRSALALGISLAFG